MEAGTVIVTAAANNNMTGSLMITVVGSTQAALTINPIGQVNVNIGDPVIIPVMSSNPNNSMLMYSTKGAPTDAVMTKEGILYWIPKSAGSFDFGVMAMDASSQMASTRVTVNVAASTTPTPPVIQPIALGLPKVGGAVSYQVVAFDPNGDALYYSLVNAPAGATIGASGVLTWTPGAEGKYSFGISVSDGSSTTVKTVDLTVVKDYDIITKWNIAAISYINAKGIGMQYSTRALTMMHTAMFDAVNSVHKSYKPYNTYIASPNASPEAAAAAAAYTVMTALYPADASTFSASYSAQLAAIPDGQPKTEDITLGQTVANNILKLRSNDNSNNANTPYPDGTKPGEYRKTGMNPMLPGWGNVKPWVLVSGNQFRLSGPPALTSVQYAAAYNETKSLGAMNSTTRTAQQSEDALFWIGGVTDLWYGVARELSGENNLNLVENARLFALLSMTFADASIAGWDSKYALGSWRPITAIRDGNLDGNSATVGDPTWQPFLSTPAFPEYGSAHSTMCGAAAALFNDFFGSDAASLTRMSSTPGLPAHEYASFSQVAHEAGASRIPAGLHFRFSNIEASFQGYQIGNYVINNAMQPLA
jgi:hypothetical protein